MITQEQADEIQRLARVRAVAFADMTVTRIRHARMHSEPPGAVSETAMQMVHAEVRANTDASDAAKAALTRYLQSITG